MTTATHNAGEWCPDAIIWNGRKMVKAARQDRSWNRYARRASRWIVTTVRARRRALDYAEERGGDRGIFASPATVIGACGGSS